MKGWILYKESNPKVLESDYEIGRFIQVAAEQDIELRIIKPDQLDLIVTKDDRKSIVLDGEQVLLPDFLLPRMGSGTTYFAMAVIRHLERLGVKTFNSASSVDAVKDKLYTQQILAESKLPVPKTMLVKFPVDITLVEKYLGFPIIVKTLSGSHGGGVYLCETRSNFEDLMHLINATRSNMNIILQEFIKTSFGRDLRVFVIGGRAVACMQRKSSDGSFKANFSRGGEVTAFEMTPEIKWLATESAKLVELDIAGIDLLFDGEHYKICEANSAPGFKGLESCTDISIPAEIYNYIKIRLGKYS